MPEPISYYKLHGEHAAFRVFAHQAITSEVYLRGDPAPTRNQVAAVLHALADRSHNQHMLGEEVAALGSDEASFGPGWAQATGLGRYFHALGDQLNTSSIPRAAEPDNSNETAAEEDARLAAVAGLRRVDLARQIVQLEEEGVGDALAGAFAALLPRDINTDVHEVLISTVVNIIAARELDRSIATTKHSPHPTATTPHERLRS